MKIINQLVKNNKKKKKKEINVASFFGNEINYFR